LPDRADGATFISRLYTACRDRNLRRAREFGTRKPCLPRCHGRLDHWPHEPEVTR